MSHDALGLWEHLSPGGHWNQFVIWRGEKALILPMKRENVGRKMDIQVERSGMMRKEWEHGEEEEEKEEDGKEKEEEEGDSNPV